MTATATAPDRASAEGSVRRLQYISFGLAGLVYAWLDMHNALAQLPALKPVPAALGYTVVATLPIVIGLLAFVAPLRVLRALMLVYVGTFALVMATWLAAMRVPVMPGGVEPWTSMLSAIPAAGLAMALPPAVTWFGVASLALGEGVLHWAASDVAASVAVQEALYMLLISSIIVALLQISSAAARATDAAARYAEQETAREAAAEARRIETARVNALVHDHVLTVLLLASRPGTLPPATLAGLARSTIDTLNAASPDERDVSGDDLVARLRAVTLAHDHSLDITLVGELTDSLPTDALPVGVAEALAEAYGQALRNSVQHAGDDAPREATLSVSEAGVRLVLRDSGRGFEPQRVPADRLGLRVSIHGRMRAAGGDARVVSTPGSGTEVELTWRR